VRFVQTGYPFSFTEAVEHVARRAGVGLFAPAAIALAPIVAALGMPLCAFNHLTGVPCPLCGGTRICAALAHGDLSVAMQLNPGLLPVLGLAALHSLLLLLGADVRWPTRAV
jgi:hypothetical protein